MSSNLSCVGLDPGGLAAFQDLVRRAATEGVELGRAGPLRVLRWEDPSGARLVLGVADDGAVRDLLPTFAGVPRTRLRDVRWANDDVAMADVVDADGDQCTSAAFELEQRRLLPDGVAGTTSAAIVALGVGVSVFDDVAAFEASDASLLDPDSASSDPPPELLDGVRWPLRIAPRSFFSYGVFADGDAATAHARLSGVVAHAERRTVAATGQQVIVATVGTAGFDVTLCLDAATAPSVPAPGAVVSGTVFLTASIEPAAEAAPPRRRGLFRRG